jgi:molybdenum cofactor cytidylyltransferase
MITMKATFPPLPVIIVLAAGYSTRLGQPKAQARIHGRTLLQHLANAIAPLRKQAVYIVVPPRSALRQYAKKAGWTCVENPNRARGLSSSVARAIERCPLATAALFLPVDLADLDTRDLQRLLSRWRGNRRRIIARDHEGRAVIPLILPRRLFDLSRLLRGDTGFKDLIAAQERNCVRRVALPSAERDIDTQADLNAARRRFGPGG